MILHKLLTCTKCLFIYLVKQCPPSLVLTGQFLNSSFITQPDARNLSDFTNLMMWPFFWRHLLFDLVHLFKLPPRLWGQLRYFLVMCLFILFVCLCVCLLPASEWQRRTRRSQRSEEEHKAQRRCWGEARDGPKGRQRQQTRWTKGMAVVLLFAII